MKWQLPRLLASVLFLLSLLGMAAGQARAGDTSDWQWSQPSVMALRRAGDFRASLVHPAYVDNLECMDATYTLVASNETKSGCFAATAFGSLDVENDLLQFAGSEGKAVPLYPHAAGEVILAWPGTINGLAIDALPNGGVSLGLYRNILQAMQDETDSLGRVTAKELTAPPDLALTDEAGNKLAANFNSLAFSSNNSWLVAEALSGSFVRINLASLQVQSFAPNFISSGNAPGLNESQVAISDDGQFVAIANSTAQSLRVYDLSKCDGAAVKQRCASHEYWPFVAAQVGELERLAHLRFLNEGLLSFGVATGSASSSLSSLYELAPAADITSLSNYLALGDSFTSGEGAYGYLPGTDTATNACHLSGGSYPLLIGHVLFNDVGSHSVACSGARTNDILPGKPAAYRGQVKDGQSAGERTAADTAQLLSSFTPGNLAQASFVAQYQPGVLSISIGGNDIGFADILQRCVAPHISKQLSGANLCYATYEDRLELAQNIDRQIPKLTELFQKLQAKAPHSTGYVIGYPQIATDTGNCAVNVHLSTAELSLSIETIIHLNAAIAAAAQAAGMQYVDISDALAGHRLCETTSDKVAVNGVTAGGDGGVAVPIGGQQLRLNFIGKESFHPTAYGQQLIAAAILRQTHNFTLHTTSPVASYRPAVQDSGLVTGPRSGRPVRTTIPFSAAFPGAAAPGEAVRLSIGSGESGFRPSTTYQVTLSGSPSSPESLTTTTEGDIDASVTIPSSASTGLQEISITGPNELGATTSVTSVIYIVNDETDYDNDGIPNDADSCPTTVNSLQDSDQDGIDDACDGLISAGPSASTPSGGEAPPPNAGPTAPAPAGSGSANTTLSVLPLTSTRSWAGPYQNLQKASQVLQPAAALGPTPPSLSPVRTRSPVSTARKLAGPGHQPPKLPVIWWWPECYVALIGSLLAYTCLEGVVSLPRSSPKKRLIRFA